MIIREDREGEGDFGRGCAPGNDAGGGKRKRGDSHKRDQKKSLSTRGASRQIDKKVCRKEGDPGKAITNNDG